MDVKKDLELMLHYNISVDQFLLERPTGKNTQRRQLDALLDGMSNRGIQIVAATAKEIAEIEDSFWRLSSARLTL